MLWITLATRLTVRTLRCGMPFALTWWSPTFPVGNLGPRRGADRSRQRRGTLFTPAPAAGPIKVIKDPPK